MSIFSIVTVTNYVAFFLYLIILKNGKFARHELIAHIILYDMNSHELPNKCESCNMYRCRVLEGITNVKERMNNALTRGREYWNVLED